jgi:hypothetical protein
MPTRTRHPIFLLPVVAAAILAGEFVCPSKAVAGCGDYVVYTNPVDANCHHQDMPTESPLPSGCHGPNCRQGPPPPTLPNLPAKSRLTSDDRASFDCSLRTPELFSTAFSSDAPSGRPDRRGTDVFHPPR